MNVKFFNPLLIFPRVTISPYVVFIYLFYKTPKAFAINLTLDSRKYPISSVYQALERSCICHCLHTYTHTPLAIPLHQGSLSSQDSLNANFPFTRQSSACPNNDRNLPVLFARHFTCAIFSEPKLHLSF